ncbi:MAG: hypothetical protein ACOC3G_06840 [Phycisphaeraceae bacterium]
MISHIARLLIAAAELIEAEGRAFRRSIFATAVALMFAMLSVVTLLFAIALLITAAFLQLQVMVGTPAATAICGAVALVVSFGILTIASRLTKSHTRSSLEDDTHRPG